MQPLSEKGYHASDEIECAAQLLATIPLVMHTIRSEMRNWRPAGLSVPQFRTLRFLQRHEGASLSDVAEHLGLALPTVSRLIDGLVKREFTIREICPTDRRRAILRPTEKGISAFDDATRNTRVRLAEMLAPLSGVQREEILNTMHLLTRIFSPKDTE